MCSMLMVLFGKAVVRASRNRLTSSGSVVLPKICRPIVLMGVFLRSVSAICLAACLLLLSLPGFGPMDISVIQVFGGMCVAIVWQI